MDEIELVRFKDDNETYKLMYKWCNKEHVYEWFEQRCLTYEEIVNKYHNKLIEGRQKLFIINYNHKPIGYTQIYKYEDKINFQCRNPYEFDLFIGEEDFLSKGLGTIIIKIIEQYIIKNYTPDCIIIRPFERNKRAIKCYLKNNYKEIDSYEDINTIGNMEKTIVFVKELDNES